MGQKSQNFTFSMHLPENSTLPPVVAVVTNMTYAGCRTFKLHCWWIVRAMAVPWMSLTGTLPQVVKNFK